MRIFLAGCDTRLWIQDALIQANKGREMEVFLADEVKSAVRDMVPIIKEHNPYILASFYYCNKDTERLIPYYGDFLLDSGAFTFMTGNHKGPIDWDGYIERYAEFIIKNKVKKYFELDIDSIVGHEKVVEYRHKLEKMVGWPCIPVWHKSRGANEFIRLCDEYDYVAVGGIVNGEIKPEQYGALPILIDKAHHRNTKIHGLGFTVIPWLRKCHFDSVDSTSWTAGNRFGYIWKYQNGDMRKISKPAGKRFADAKQLALINYMEWIKFQKYAERCL